MPERISNQESPERKAKISELAKEHAETHLLSLKLLSEEDLTEEKNSPTQIWRFINDPKKLSVDPSILQAGIQLAEEKLGPLSDNEEAFYKEQYNWRIYMGSPKNEA